MTEFFPNFERSLQTRRRLKAFNWARFIRTGPQQIMRGEPVNPPELLYEDDDITCFHTSSYARTPGGETVVRIESLLQNHLPDDFRAFYTRYAEALLITRSYPIHFWPIEKIEEEFADMRYKKPYPLRFVRFGEYWDLGSTQFGIWQKNPGEPDWRVVSTYVDIFDDDYDDPTYKAVELGNSFHGWLEHFVATDGLKDPFLKRFAGDGEGFLDLLESE